MPLLSSLAHPVGSALDRFMKYLLLACALCFSGCGQREQPALNGPPPTFAQQLRRLEVSSLEFGKGELSDGDDRVFIRTIRFSGEQVFDRFELDGNYVLEYLPLVEAGDAAFLLFEAVLRDQEGREHVLDRRPPVASDHHALIGDRRAHRAAEVVQVDLSRWWGQEVVLMWRLIQEVGHADSKATRPLPRAHIGRLALRPKDEDSPPDILLVCSDTHRYDFGVGLGIDSLMPHTEQFAKSAVRFDQALSTSSWTLPSVASALTGLYPRSHLTGRTLESGNSADWKLERRLGSGEIMFGWGDRYHVISTFPKEIDTLAERLGLLGYTTVMISANSLLRLSGLGEDGVDYFHSVGQSRAGRIKEIVAEIAPLVEDRRPLFLYIQLIDVHEYQHIPESELPKEVQLAGPAAVQMYQYRKEVGHVDRFFGQLIERWDAEVGRDQSMVAFFSDHGEHLRDPGGPKHGHGVSMHDVLLHVPLVVRFPRFLEVPPTVVDSTVSLVDLATTVAEVAGGEAAKTDQPGRSLIELALHGAESQRVVFADYQLMGDESSVAQAGHYKLVKNFSRGTSILYDLELDSNHGEPAMVIEDSAIRSQLEIAFARYVRESNVASSNLKSKRIVDAVDAEAQLKALGYAE